MQERVYTQAVPGRLASYLLREVSALYLVGVAAFCLLLSIDYVSVMASFLLTYDATLSQVGMLLLYKLPYFLHLSLPIAGVFAVLLATGRLAKDSELKAAYALGVPPQALIRPLLGFGVVIAGLAVVNNGWVEPVAERSYTRLVESFYSSRPPTERQLNVAFGLPDGTIHYAAEIRSLPEDSARAELSGVLVLQPDGTSLHSQRGQWDSESREWRLDDAERVTPEGEPELLGEFTVPFEFAGSPEATLTREELLTISELIGQRERVGLAGGSTRELSFEIQRRLADAASGLTFVLIAAILGVGVRERAAAFALTIGLLVAFYALWTVSSTLFDRNVLTAVQAAWLTPAIVAAASVLLGVWRLRR